MTHLHQLIAPASRSLLPRGSAGLSLLLAAALLACSAPESGVDDDDVPEFQGPLNTGGGASTAPAGSNTGAATPPSSTGTGAPATGVATPTSGNETPANLPVANGTGGTSNTGNANASSGAGGSAMVGAGGNGAEVAPTTPPSAGGAAQMPPVQPPPTQPPPTQPPPVQPPPVQPPPAVLPGGFYLIDDFEGGRDPQWTESEVGGGAGTFTIDTTGGANGSSSSMRIDSNNAFHTMLQFALPQAVRDANEVFGRVYLRLAATPSAAHFIWVEVGTTANDGHEMRLGYNVGRLQSNHFLNGEQDIRDQNRTLDGGVWYCLEFQMANDPDELRVWLDGEETALSTTNYTAGPGAQGNTNPVADFIPPLEAFRIGWELQNGTISFDDVALANARIGCE
jgi:hypothetical protein